MPGSIKPPRLPPALAAVTFVLAVLIITSPLILQQLNSQEERIIYIAIIATIAIMLTAVIAKRVVKET